MLQKKLKMESDEEEDDSSDEDEEYVFRKLLAFYSLLWSRSPNDLQNIKLFCGDNFVFFFP